MSRHPKLVVAVTVALALLAPVVTAEGSQNRWYPGCGVAQVYSWNSDDDLTVAALHLEPLVTGSSSVTFDDPEAAGSALLEQVALVSEDSEDTRVHTDIEGNTLVTGAGLGAGAGLGKDASQVTFADANAAAIKAAAAAAVQQGQMKTGQSVRGAAKGKQPLVARSWFGWMRFSMSFAFLVKALCMMCNICYQASPLPLITGFKAKGDTGSADLAPFIAVAYGGWQWCFYGLFAYIVTSKSGFLVLVYSNVVGATLGLYYVYTFTLNCNNAAMLQRSSKYYYVLACVACVQIIAIMTLQPVRALFFSGLISSAWSTVASLSLISTVPTVYKNRSSVSLPVPLLFMGEISAALWVLCGVVLWDPWITFPNCFAFVVCTFALYLCWKFPPDGVDAIHCEDGEDEPILRAKEVDVDEPSHFVAANASPLQRALGFVKRSSASSENLALHDSQSSARLYGGTGGTGDGF